MTSADCAPRLPDLTRSGIDAPAGRGDGRDTGRDALCPVPGGCMVADISCVTADYSSTATAMAAKTSSSPTMELRIETIVSIYEVGSVKFSARIG